MTNQKQREDEGVGGEEQVGRNRTWDLRDLAVKKGEVPPEKNGTVMFQVSLPSHLPMTPTCKSRAGIWVGKDGKGLPSDPAQLIIAVTSPCPGKGGWNRAEHGWAGWLRVP